MEPSAALSVLPAGWGRSLGLLTELAVLWPASRIEDRGDHLVIRTPGQPGYYWGNFLAFRDPPGPDAHRTWPRHFEAAFGHDPAIRHMTFAWDDPAGALGELSALEAAGFAGELGVVLTASRTSLPRPATPGLVVRPLESDADWEAATLNQVACRSDGFELEAYTRFKRARMATYREMARAGRGAWFGAFLDGTLVGELGLFTIGGVARYQSVGTHPDYRRRGVCATLVHAAADHARAHWGVARLVIVAEPGEDAERVYRSVGFEPTERFAGLCRRPEAERA
ncbi:Acetyltransferase (GNAT) family protein [compost metagenome]